MLAGTLSGGWSNDSDTSVYPRYSQWWLALEPSLTHFVANRVGVGLSLGAGFGRSHSYDSGSGSLGTHGFFDVRLSERTSLFIIPSMGVRYQRANLRVLAPESNYLQDGPGQDLERKRVLLNFGSHVVLAYHPAPNVALGIGPRFAVDLLLRERTDGGSYSGARYPLSQEWRAQLELASFVGASF